MRLEDTIKVDVLHSLSGTMAISKTSLRDAVLPAVEEINAASGVLGKQIAPVVVDPASDWPLFYEKVQELIVDEEVAVVFGCWTSVSRTSVLPAFEEHNALLFYPVQYEGEESRATCSTPGRLQTAQRSKRYPRIEQHVGIRCVLTGSDDTPAVRAQGLELLMRNERYRNGLQKFTNTGNRLGISLENLCGADRTLHHQLFQQYPEDIEKRREPGSHGQIDPPCSCRHWKPGVRQADGIGVTHFGDQAGERSVDQRSFFHT